MGWAIAGGVAVVCIAFVLYVVSQFTSGQSE